VCGTVVWYSLGMKQSRADQLADQLSLDILRGVLPAGTRLPSVRSLAKAHSVSASTVQRVLMVLETRGLVRSLDRSGVEVRDPERHASLSVWPLLVRHGHETPRLALRLLDDVLATRRTLAIDVVRAVLTGDRAVARAALAPEVAAFVDAARAPDRSAEHLCAIEHDLLRSVLIVADRPAVLGILNGIEQVVTASPALVEALYADPQVAADAWASLLLLLDHADPLSLMPLLDAALTAADDKALAIVRGLFPQPETP